MQRNFIKPLFYKLYFFFRYLFLKILICLSLAVSLVACSGSSSSVGVILNEGGGTLGVIPKLLLQTANNGSLHAELSVFGLDATLIHEQGLQINMATGEVFGEQFQLPRGFTYTFVVLFTYNQDPYGFLPIAFVAKQALAEETFLAFSWTASEVLISQNQLSPQISAAIGSLPLVDISFDPDLDTYVTFDELREGANPLSASSIPEAPEVEVVEILATADEIEAVVTFRDASGVSTLKPSIPYRCGYTSWEVESLDSASHRVRLHFRFNLHSYANIAMGDSLSLPIQVSDVLGLKETHEILISSVQKNLVYPSELDLPSIAILSPESGEEVSGFVSIEAIACDEDGISFLGLLDVPGVIDNNPAANVFSGVLDTSNQGDGNQIITLQATDIPNNFNTQSVVVQITNLNPILVISPTPGAILQGSFNLILDIDRVLFPDVTNLFVEKVTDTTSQENEIFALNPLKSDLNILPEAFTGQVYDTSNVPNQEFIVHAVAVGTNGKQVRRRIRYRINNYPQIQVFDGLGLNGPRACINGGDVNLQWQVENVGIDGSVTIAGEEVPPVGTSQASPFECNTQMTMFATRIAVDGNTGAEQALQVQETLELILLNFNLNQASGIMQPEEFEILVEASDPFYNLANLHWEIAVTNESLGSTQLRYATGSMITNTDLELTPFSDYHIQLTLQNVGGQDISTSPFISFTTSDDGLVGRYNFENVASLGQDRSGADNNGINLGATQLGTDCAYNHCASFDGISDIIQINHDPSLDQAGGFTIRLQVNWGGDPADPLPEGVILIKEGQYSLTNTAAHLRFSVWDFMGNEQFIDFPINIISPDTWNELTMIYNPGTGVGDEEISLQVNNEIPLVLNVEPITDGSNPLLIGGSGIFGEFFQGTLDEILIYNRPLSFGELSELGLVF